MSKKLLPISVEPYVKTYPFNAFYFGILEANGYEISSILMKEFINMHCYYYRNKWHIDFCGSGYIEKKRFNTKYEIKLNNINIEKIKNEIENDYYVMINLNERYLCTSEIEWEEDRYHEWLVYGFDDENEVFYCCGYINRKGLGEYYGTILVKYENLIISAKNVPKKFTIFRSHKLQNHSFKINRKYTERVLTEKELMKKLLCFYKPPKKIFHYSPWFLNDCNGLSLYLKKFKQNNITSNNRIDIYLPDIRNIYEHKKVIKLALEKLNCEQELVERQNALIKDSYSVLLICAKQFLNQQEGIIEKIHDKLLEIEKKQKEIIFNIKE